MTIQQALSNVPVCRSLGYSGDWRDGGRGARCFVLCTRSQDGPCAFEHSGGNMYFLPIGLTLAIGTSTPLSVGGALGNLLLVTIDTDLSHTVRVALT